MQNNRLLHIAIGKSRFDTDWINTEIYWGKLLDRLKDPVRTQESISDFLSYRKPDQDRLKDIGGFVGGTLSGSRRKGNSVSGRDIVTLDMDSIEAGKTDDVVKRVAGLGCAYSIYSTRKHTGYAPRLRVLIPLDRTCTSDEYEPIARKLAELIGITMCDRTTFQASRMMYWPSCSSDSIYVFEYGDKGFCCADQILSMYEDWRDVQTWPRVPGEDTDGRKLAAKQEDPLKKSGIVGAFCRSYTIPEAMDAYLPGLYEETATEGRYTYTGGSTSGGAVLYNDGIFLYSHHATDPCSCKLVNAFDLVRIHKYGDLDDDARQGTPVAKMPSYLAMLDLAKSDKKVTGLMLKERHEHTADVFGDTSGKIIQMPGITSPAEDGTAALSPYPEDDSWMNMLDTDKTGAVRKTIGNAVIILEHDPAIAGRIVVDDFAGKSVVIGAVPWNRDEDEHMWTDSDDSGLRHYMEVGYGLSGRDKIDDALTIVSNKNRINRVRDYLMGLSWDGVHRLDKLLIDYLGAEDSEYVRSVTRKTMCAAVARAISGGVKFDYMLILTGKQGLGKSTLLAKLGGKWFSDSLTTFEGKEAAELIQGTWINEIGELTALTRQETEIIKQFLSKTHDIYRAAYGRRTERHPRRCIFIGTSNQSEFLRDETGNRRFWPIDVGIRKPVKSVFDDLDGEVDQIWAEAYAFYAAGEKLYLPPELEKIAMEQQEAHRLTSEKEGIIMEFLEKPIPENWYSMDSAMKRVYLSGGLRGHEKLMQREKVCAVEIWEECFHQDKARMKKSDSSEINRILEHLDGWKKCKDKLRFGSYGAQRGYERSKGSYL